MIITLKGANFGTNNIGTLSTWTVSRVLGDGATYSGAAYVNKNSALNATVTIAEGYELGAAGVTVTMGGVVQVYTIVDNVITINISSVTGNVVIKVPTKNIVTGGESSGDDANDPNVVFSFDFTKSTLADYADDGIFTVPEGSTIDAITYDATYGMNLNNNLPNGLNLVNPIDASRAWTLEFTSTFATPTDLVGNRRAFLTGSTAVSGSTMTPFIVVNGGTLPTMGFQISNGSHKYAGAGKLSYETEVSYVFVHDGAGNVSVTANGTSLGTVTIDYTDAQFEVLLGAASGKSTAYIWKDVEAGKKSYLKKIKFYYN
jgi:hypothetical protein